MHTNKPLPDYHSTENQNSQNGLDSKEISHSLSNLSDEHCPIDIIKKVRFAVEETIKVVVTNHKGFILFVNQNCCKLSNYSPEELIGRHTSLFNSGYHPPEFFANLWGTLLSGSIWKGELRNKRKDGSLYWVHMKIVPVLNHLGEPYQFVSLQEDITAQKKREFELTKKDKQLSALTKNSTDVVGIYDANGTILYQNSALAIVLGYKMEETLGLNIFDFVFGTSVKKGETFLNRIKKNPKKPIRMQHRIKHKDGSVRWCDVVHTNYLDDPYINGIVFNLRDFTEQMEATQSAYQLAYYDYLTGLPNRRLFEKQLQIVLEQCVASYKRFALMYLDLDGFKNINDNLGHEVGDILLQKVAERISATFEKKAFIGRLGGDEFSLIFPNMISLKYLHNMSKKMLLIFSRPFLVRDIELFVSPSVGISIFPFGGRDIKTLLKNADVAMYSAKNGGKNNYQIYSPAMDENAYKKFLLKNDLKKAISEEQFFVVYQPRVNPSTHEINGVEALIRWNHSNFGPVSPLEFIPYAEETGLIIPLGYWILTKVCKQVKQWQREGIKPIKASVNISAIQLLQTDFISSVQSILKKTKLAPEWLELEITETVLLNKEDIAIATLEKLREMGITIALDDFGTGYSSLNYLVKYKFDVIKIDRSILKNIPNDIESYEIANAIVKLAQKLNKTVVAEGIETPSQLALIEKMGCNEFQGYICSQPVKEEQIKQFLFQGKWQIPILDFQTLFENDPVKP